MNDCPPAIETLHGIQVCLLFWITGTPHNSKTSLHEPYTRLTKYVFLYIWLYSWPAVITFCFLLLRNFIWHMKWLLATTYAMPAPWEGLSVLRWPQACSNVGKLPWAVAATLSGRWALGNHVDSPQVSKPRSSLACEAIRRGPQGSVEGVTSSTSHGTWQHDPAPPARDFMICRT